MRKRSSETGSPPEDWAEACAQAVRDFMLEVPAFLAGKQVSDVTVKRNDDGTSTLIVSVYDPSTGATSVSDWDLERSGLFEGPTGALDWPVNVAAIILANIQED